MRRIISALLILPLLCGFADAGMIVRGSAGAGPTLVYGPDYFVVGSDIELNAYNSDWVKQYGDDLTVVADADMLREAGPPTVYGIYAWTGQTLVDQKIQADIATWGEFAVVSLYARAIYGTNAYYAQWYALNGEIKLYKYVEGVVDHVEIAAGGTVIADAEYDQAYIRVTGTNPVRIQVGDIENGEVIDFSDSTASRIQSGQPGIEIYAGTGGTGTIDGIWIYEE